MLDESKIRRPEFTEGERITLGDGQEWVFPLPAFVEFRPQETDDGQVRFNGYGRFSYGSGWLARLDKLVEVDESEDSDSDHPMNGLLSLAWDLLRRNYDLKPSDAARLFPFVRGIEGERVDSNAEMWEDVAAIAYGQKKSIRIATGSDSASTSPDAIPTA